MPIFCTYEDETIPTTAKSDVPVFPPSGLETLTIGQILAIRRSRSQYAGLAHCILVTGYLLSRRKTLSAIERVIVRAAEELCRISTPSPLHQMGSHQCGIPNHPTTLAEALEMDSLGEGGAL